MSRWKSGPPRDQPVLTAVAVAAVALCLPVLVLGGAFRAVMVPGVVLAAALMAAGRETLHALAGLAIVALLWVTADPAAMTPWNLVLAVLMTTGHAAAALRSSVFPGAWLDPVIVRRWLRRGLAVSGLTTVVYLIGLAMQHLDHNGGETVPFVALLLLAGLILVLRRETIGNGSA
jgi:hypothetical protein